MNGHYWGTLRANSAINEAYAQGKAILAESDTIWGLFIPVTKAGAFTLDNLKKRRDKPYLVIMDCIASVNTIALFPDNGSYALAQTGWPGPLTLLLPAYQGILDAAQSPLGVMGVRVPDHEPLRIWAAKYGGLFSTSANLSGEPIPSTYKDINASIGNAVGAVIYNNFVYKPYTQPSTIVDCTGPELKVIRHGAYPNGGMLNGKNIIMY